MSETAEMSMERTLSSKKLSGVGAFTLEMPTGLSSTGLDVNGTSRDDDNVVADMTEEPSPAVIKENPVVEVADIKQPEQDPISSLDNQSVEETATAAGAFHEAVSSSGNTASPRVNDNDQASSCDPPPLRSSTISVSEVPLPGDEASELPPSKVDKTPLDIESALPSTSPSIDSVTPLTPRSMDIFTELPRLLSSPPVSPSHAAVTLPVEMGKMYSVDLSPRRGAFMAKTKITWRDRIRRYVQQYLVRAGRAVPASDAYYVAQEERFLRLLSHLVRIRGSLVRHRDLLPPFATSASQLGVDVWTATHANTSSDDSPVQDVHATDIVVGGAIRCLDTHIAKIESYRPLMATRAELKLDFDSYDRRARQLAPSARKARVETKLMEARVAFESCTLQLYRVFARYENERATMLHGELEMVRQALHAFLETQAKVMQIPIDPPAAPCMTKEEELFREMKTMGLTTPPPVEDIPTPML
ncbi:Aste57867_199 [Aphanomyces stellatus]|uniref:Aste57867_199 protein n=1 Tax=Aphanomyces stellatus TaxID=120398 RepID=A0A485K280_9STRA|nr:hypothetical protein As57867_000199 [Aphanomyces stellatus]VFT77425.1 Aste57867_199 [Aphanomyces stellatus]